MCFVPKCNHYSEKHACRFFVFPSNPAEKKRWISLIRRKDREPSKYSLVCSCHFVNMDRKNRPTIFKFNDKKKMNFEDPEKRKRTVKSKNVDRSLEETAPSSARKVNALSDAPSTSGCESVSSNVELIRLTAGPLGSSTISGASLETENYYLRQRKMIDCWAPGCDHNNMRDECNFFRFPQEDELRNQWTQLTRSTASPGPVDFLCSCHFVDGKKENGPTLFECNADKTTHEKDLEIEGHIQSSKELESYTVCAVPGCTSTSSDECLEFFPFPQSKTISYKWLQFCGSAAKDLDTRTAYICRKHFEESSYITKIENFGDVTCLIRALCYDAVPVINHPNSSKVSEKLEGKSGPNLNGDEQSIQLDSEVYGHIKTQADLQKLKIYNERLKKKNKLCEMNLKANQKTLKQKEAMLASLESQVSQENVLYEDALANVFSKRQIKHLCGQKKTHWTEDDLAVGLTIRYLSTRTFYNYLTNTLNFPLPALSTIGRYIFINKKKSGSSSRSLLKDIN